MKERYGDDKKQFSEALMKIYKEEKVNPLGGCLPILIQIPVFIALYWVIIESVEMRHAPFIGWIEDLSSADPLIYFTGPYGDINVCSTKTEPCSYRSNAGKNISYPALCFYLLICNFPIRACSLLGNK